MIERSETNPAWRDDVPGDVSPAVVAARSPARRRRRDHAAGPPDQGLKMLQPVPGWLWVATLLLAGWGALTANPVLTPCALLMLPAMASLLWFRGHPPVLLFACVMQWLQASAAVFYTNLYGVPLSVERDYGSADLVRATWLSLAGVMVLAVGMRLALAHCRRDVATETQRDSHCLRLGTVFAFYLVGFVFFAVVGRVAVHVSALEQPLRAAATLKWVFVFLLAHGVITQRRQYGLLWAAVFLEMITGVMGYFSSFKDVFFILLVVLPGAHFMFRGVRLAQFSAVAAVVLALAVVWTAVKADYREFLNQGTGEQVVLVPVADRLAKLNELVGHLNLKKVDEAFEQLILRVSYVSMFALTLGNVPDSVPYEKGALWLGSIQHVLMPRFLFPDKAAIHDSERTNQYTGLQVASVEQGTSISLGYMAESYVDFGPMGMFAPILLLGVFYGLIYRFFVFRYRHGLLGLAMAASILIFGAYSIETSNIKLVGGNMMGLIVLGTFATVAGSWLWRLIAVPTVVAPQESRSGHRRRPVLAADRGTGPGNAGA